VVARRRTAGAHAAGRREPFPGGSGRGVHAAHGPPHAPRPSTRWLHSLARWARVAALAPSQMQPPPARFSLSDGTRDSNARQRWRINRGHSPFPTPEKENVPYLSWRFHARPPDGGSPSNARQQSTEPRNVRQPTRAARIRAPKNS
jgi:hypothetical protein